MKKALALILALAMAFTFAACGSKPETAPEASPGASSAPSAGAPTTGPVVSEPPKQDTLIIALEGEGNDFDPQNSGTKITSAGIICAVYENLVRCDENGVPYGVLAESFEWLNEGKAIRFKLRKNVTFSNGETFTADDVVFSYKERFPTSSNGKSEGYFDFANMEVVNDYEIIIPMKKDASDALNTLTNQRYGIMNRKAVVELGDQAGRKPVGTGAYMLDELVAGDRIVLKANPNYWGDQPYFKQVTYRVIKENSQAQIELENGTIDAAVFSVGNSDVLRVSNGEIPGLECVKVFNGVNSLRLNFKKEFANNKLIRQALNYALDREAIAKADSNNLNTPAYHPNIPGYGGYIKEFDTNHPYPYNPEKAIELLKEAGVYGSLTLECYTDVSAAATMDAQLVKNMLEKVGITMNIHSLEAGTVVPIVLQGEENDCILGFNIADWTGSVLQRQRMSCDPNYSPQFEQHSKSDAYDGVYEIFARAEKALNREEAIKLIEECARLEMEEALNVPLTYTNNFINCKEGLQVVWRYGDVNLAQWRFA